MLTMRELYDYLTRIWESENGLWTGDLPESVTHELHQTRVVWQQGEYLQLTALGRAIFEVKCGGVS
jgi:hypothetical protein